MELTSGNPDIAVGLIDGPVDLNHPSLHGRNIRSISTQSGGACAQVNNGACTHGTFVAGILCASRDSSAPAICPDCTLLVRPVFSENTSHSDGMTSATPEALAIAIVESINAGARILNMSLSLLHHHSSGGARVLKDALDYAARRGVIAIAAAGNQGTVGSSSITRHPWVIPVVASDGRGRPLADSNLGSSIGTRGISAPGDFITSLRAGGTTFTSGGTSVAVPFVTGTAALLWSMFPGAGAAQVKLAVTQPLGWRRAVVVPPLLDAWAAYRAVQSQIKVGA
jgi:subtilisin family serine protease